MALTKLQQEVVDKAKEELAFDYGYKGGVCLDVLPCDSNIEKDFDAAVCAVVLETMLWENLSIFSINE